MNGISIQSRRQLSISCNTSHVEEGAGIKSRHLTPLPHRNFSLFPSFTHIRMQEDVPQLISGQELTMPNQTTPSNPPWEATPTEILLLIAGLLPLENQVILSYVCRRFYIALGSPMRKFAVKYHLRLRNNRCDPFCLYNRDERLALLRLLEKDGLIARGKLICERYGILHDLSCFSPMEQEKAACERQGWASNRWCSHVHRVRYLGR